MIAIMNRAIAPFVLALAATWQPALAESGPSGIWIDHTGRGAVEITNCDGGLCGRIVWVKDVANNAVCGRQIIGSVKPIAAGKWDGGWIYDPEKEAKYDVEITQLGDQKLKVMGYAGVKFLSETMIWTRAPDALKRCDDKMTPASANPGSAITFQPEPAPAASPSPPVAEAPVSERPGPSPRNIAAARAEQEACTIRLPFVVITMPCIE